jgi:hypothetical protein
MNADPTPRMAVVRIARTTRTKARADLRMCQRPHNGDATVGGTRKLIRQSSPRLSDSRGAARRTGREWNTRVLLTSGR